MFLVTVMHTGSMSLKKAHPDLEHRHCDAESLQRVREGEKAITTYRDPELVAATWHRHGWFDHKKFWGMWFLQWWFYRKILENANIEVIPTESLDHHINAHPDNIAIAPLDPELAEFAYECSTEARSPAQRQGV